MPDTSSVLDTSIAAAMTATQGPVSGPASLSFLYEERVRLSARALLPLTLSGDGAIPVTLPFASVHLLGLRVTDGPKVLLSVTHADGTAQKLPVEEVLWLSNSSAAITAITLTRTLGQESSVELLLGQRA